MSHILFEVTFKTFKNIFFKLSLKFSLNIGSIFLTFEVLDLLKEFTFRIRRKTAIISISHSFHMASLGP